MSSNPSDPQLVTRLLDLTKGLTGREVADAVGVTEANVSKWRNGKVPKYLHAPTRARIEAILAQPGWKYVASIPPSKVEEREAVEQAAYAAGVLWTVAQQARHLADMAEEAHARLRGAGASGQQPKARAKDRPRSAVRVSAARSGKRGA